jgi:2-oxoglutarate ferredoxin oxidoreductase subunit alpha
LSLKVLLEDQYIKDASIVLAGAAGQGIETVAGFLATILKLTGYYVFVNREFMSRIRGGTNSLQLRVSSDKVGSYILRSDIVIPLTKEAIPHLVKYGRTSNHTIFLGEKEILDSYNIDSQRLVPIPFSNIAYDIGGRIYANTVAAGVVADIFGVKEETAHAFLQKRFSRKGEEVVKKNLEAFRAGQKYGKVLKNSSLIMFRIEPNDMFAEKIILNGTEAIALGAIAGGCNFIASYPMSPSTGVLTFLASRAKKMGIVIDQAEDEIAAINKGIGAWYAGGRAIVTTSGGGFSLMAEGLSLAGMTETPIVIHLAQRPGPATGLPTRTEQGDLQLALYSGHGEFPRVIYAPGTPSDGFMLAQRAFNVADKYQVPVIILTDQYFVDSTFMDKAIDLDKYKVEKHIIETKLGYQRYELTEDGVSRRGIPGHGNGMVNVDSDEHDEDGHITEDLHLRTRMVDKRLKLKMERLREESLAPILIGNKNYKSLVIGWGSNNYGIQEALRNIGRGDVAMLYFNQVYPLHTSTPVLLENADQVLSVENNATGQFSRLIHAETGFRISKENVLLKYDGLPFPVESIQKFVENKIGDA